MRTDEKATGLRWLALVVFLLLAIVLPYLLFEQSIETWAQSALNEARERPLLGAGVIVVLLAGDVALPVPSSLISAAAGIAFGWQFGALLIWAGMSLGAVFGYLLGTSAGHALAVRVVGADAMTRARRLAGAIGPTGLIISRAVPVLAEATVLAAGAARMRFLPFLLSTLLANAGVAAAYAYVGATAASTGSFLVVFLGVVGLPVLAWGIWRLTIKGGRS